MMENRDEKLKSAEKFPPLTILSNREPYSFKKGVLKRNIGGLVSALEPVLRREGGRWVAYGEGLKRNRVLKIPSEKGDFQLWRLALKKNEFGGYYYGFSNRVLWPLFHQFLEKCAFINEYWKDYKSVNKKFADFTLKIPSQEVVWVQDFHLMLVPSMLRARRSTLKIMFFLHIPWPAPSIFAALPWRKEILEGVLGSDLIGFHTQEFASNFLASVKRILKSAQVTENSIVYKGHTTKVEAIPIGIDFGFYRNLALQKKTQKLVEKFKKNFANRKIILGVDRLDYTKGILRRLWAIENFFDRYPEWKGKCCFVQIATPSREGIDEYVGLKREVERTVGRIEGRFGKLDWQPIYYFYRKYSSHQLVAFYRLADVALLTPLFDGWNLVASEYVASQVDGNGVLILSEFAGASSFFSQALIVNPYDTVSLASTLNKSLKMKLSEKKKRIKAMAQMAEENSVFEWFTRHMQAISLQENKYV